MPLNSSLAAEASVHRCRTVAAGARLQHASRLVLKTRVARCSAAGPPLAAAAPRSAASRHMAKNHIRNLGPGLRNPVAVRQTRALHSLTLGEAVAQPVGAVQTRSSTLDRSLLRDRMQQCRSYYRH